VIAVDTSQEMLSRVRGKALDLGLADRVITLQADLDEPWPAIEGVDVVWASMSLHHFADPDRVLKDVLATLRPGGLLAALEIDAPLRFLPEDIGSGRPGLEARCHAAVAHDHATSLPHLGADWGLRMERAGFVSVVKRTFTIDLKPPHSTPTGRYAHGSFQRLRPLLEGRLSTEDLAALDVLIDSDGPQSLLHRTDLNVRGERTAWVAHRP
jgi:SAM-dependent methyltransferase